MMLKSVFLAVIGGTILLPASLRAAPANEPEPGQIASSVGKALEQLHYTRHSLDKTISDRLLRTYIETLDYGKLFFTQKDIDDFARKYSDLSDSILLGDLSPAYVIYDAYVKRVEDRVAKIKELIKNEKFDFTSNRAIEISRQKSPWPKDSAEADSLWHDRIENELLSESLSEHAIDKPEIVVAKRYDRLLRSVHEQTKPDEAKFYLSTLAQAYDPHSEYLSPSELENFSIQMRLSLVGIGAMLRSEDGYSKIVDLVPGGPAAVQGELKVDDRISAVAQGNDAFVDVVDMKLDKVVEMIRGKKGTTVRLQVIPSGATDASKRKVIAIVRDEVKLTDGEARAEIIEQKNERGQTERLGWITLPSFYAEMDHRSRGPSKSTTADVRRLLDRLNKEGINGLVIDLRKNGGGSLEEAINLTGLFIKKGPVVQSKDYNKQILVQSDKDPSISYNGPMVVLTSHVSASASEIFAGALQDYDRAVIVGDKNTFGKGTVQTMLEVGRFMSPFGLKMADAGALKLTIQKFYRPSGASTQLKGVESDVVVPSLYAHLDSVGEDALKFPLPWDEVKPADFEKWSGSGFDAADLRTRSAARVKAEPEFRYLQEKIDRSEARIASNKLSLNKAERQAEIETDKKRVEQIKAERLARRQMPPPAFQLTLADVDKSKLQLVSHDKGKGKEGAPKAPSTEDDGADALSDDTADSSSSVDAVDPIKTEALNILADVIDQQRRPRLVKTKD
jgi:carboxyl-terminal processing protease